MTLEQLDLIAGWAGLVLTLMVFSYLLADNFLYRVAVHILVGAASVYVTLTAIEEIVVPWVNLTLADPGSGQEGLALAALGITPFVVGLFLLFKLIPRYAPLGNLGSSLIIGVGTGVALVGVVLGTVFPLIEDTGRSFQEPNALNAIVLGGGTLCTLLYFQYVVRRDGDGQPRRPLPLQVLALLGQGVIAITLGALYAGAILTSLNIFSSVVNEQLRFVLEQLGG